MTEIHEKTLTVTVNMPGLLDQDARSLFLRIEGALVESDEEYVALTEALAEVKRRHEAYQYDKRALKKPVIALACEIHSTFRVPISILDSAIRISEEKLVAYDNLKRNQADAQAAANARHRDEATKRKAGDEVAVAPSATRTAAAAARASAEAQVPAAFGNSQRRSRRMSWGWNITDIEKVDSKWFILDVKAIDKVVADHGGDSLTILGDGFGVMYEYAIGLTPNR